MFLLYTLKLKKKETSFINLKIIQPNSDITSIKKLDVWILRPYNSDTKKKSLTFCFNPSIVVAWIWNSIFRISPFFLCISQHQVKLITSIVLDNSHVTLFVDISYIYIYLIVINSLIQVFLTQFQARNRMSSWLLLFQASWLIRVDLSHFGRLNTPQHGTILPPINGKKKGKRTTTKLKF